jgi:hypothetical protein
VLIEGLTFVCEFIGLNIREGGPHQGLVVRDNVFRTKDWVKLVNNDLRSSSLGIHFFESHDCEAVNNLIQGGWEGVLVGTGGCGHKIVNNQIHEIQSGGLSFEGGNFGNQVTANRVWCASPGACELIKAGDGPDFYRNNKVQANRLMR